MKDKNLKDKNMKDKNFGKLYGRARRIEFAEKIAYFLVGIIAIFLVFFVIFNQKGFVDDNLNFAYLREYMEANGYYCEMIHSSGGSCTLKGQNSTSTFTRYEDGFQFIVKSDAYHLAIKHISSAEDFIEFRTYSKALAGYKSKNYICTTKDNIIGELESCVSSDGEVLDADSYISIIEIAIKDLNNFIDSSGYYKKNLIEDYEWVKK